MFKMFSMTLLGLLTFSAAQAQSSQPIRAEIPFAFTVQNMNLAAGNYQLKYNNTAHILSIRDLDQNSESSFANFIPADAAPSSNRSGRLVFRCYGNNCDLAQVWQGVASGGRGLEVRETPHQTRLSFSTRVVSITIPAK